MKIKNETFLKERQYIKDTMKYYDGDGNFISSIPLNECIFIKYNSKYYQVLGINSSFVNTDYIEIFVTIDITETMKFFDGRAVKTYYFNEDTLMTTIEIKEQEVKQNYTRAEWRRFQKYVKKEKINIVKNTKKNK